MDAQTGRIMYAENASASIAPASLTKMMTILILFEDLVTQKVSFNSLIKVSKNASKQSPSKLGIPAGNTIQVRDALLALVTRSANDMAVAIAEKLSGSVESFVQRMNATAKALHMTQTHFENPSGLPHKRQVTSALDMAKLSQALLKKFPIYYHYFNTKSFQYKGEQIRNHNKLLGKIEGLDGIKTGFVCASGFNIATSAVRKGRRLISVVMGGETAKWRDQRVTQLLEAGFGKFSMSKNNIIQLVNREDLNDSMELIPVKKKSISLSSSELDSKKEQSIALTTKIKNKSVTDITTNKLPINYYIQVGTFRKAKEAHMAAAHVMAKLSDLHATIVITKHNHKNSKIYRARLGQFQKKSAEKLCKTLKKQGVSCVVVKDSNPVKMMTVMANRN